LGNKSLSRDAKPEEIRVRGAVQELEEHLQSCNVGLG
jgi:hypothetical protein